MLRKSFLGMIIPIIGIVLAFCLFGCGGSNPLNGIWFDEDCGDQRIVFKGSNWTYQYLEDTNWVNDEKGTFSLNESKTEITFNITHYWEDGKWVEDPDTKIDNISISQNIIKIYGCTYRKQ